MSYAEKLRKQLIQKSNPKTKAWWEGYVKDSAPFLGVKMAEIRKIMNQWCRGSGGRARTLAVWLQTDEADDIVTVLKPGRVLGSLRCYARSGERVGQGQRQGFILLGTDVQVLLPTGVRLRIAPGDKVRAGADIIADLVHG